MRRSRPCVAWQKLHDTTVDSARLDWRSGTSRLNIRWEDGTSPAGRGIELLATETSLFQWPRQQPWGRSDCINEVRGPTAVSDDLVRLEIEMQSGDLITIEAASVDLVWVTPDESQGASQEPHQ